jgi:hypothetical protein
MTQSSDAFSGGCQCGAIRFRAETVGRASICHCRMCQKATGGFFGAYVTGRGVTWTRGGPSYFLSSNKIRRGFCSACGTPLTFEQLEGLPPGQVELSIAAFDEPTRVAPVIQVNLEGKLDFVDHLAELPTAAEPAAWTAFKASIVSHQHPDHDTETWPPAGGPPN